MRYKLTGPFIIDEINPTYDTLDQALKVGEEYAQSFAQGRSVYVRIATEFEPIEYIFSFVDKGEHNEICRAVRSAYV